MYRLITARDLQQRLDAGDELHVVDLRAEELFVAGHLPGAMLVPSGVRVERWIPQRFPTTGEIVLYDGGGDETWASHEASHLGHLWYHGVLVLQGGFSAWRDAGLAVEESAPVDPLGAGRHLDKAPPPAGAIPEEFAPRD